MHNCVAVYDRCCVVKHSSIFSIRRRAIGCQDLQFKRMATVEIRPETRQIVQVRAKFNDRPNDRAIEFLHAWAAAEKLTLAEHCLDA